MTYQKLLAGTAAVLLATAGAQSLSAQQITQPIERVGIDDRPGVSPVGVRTGVLLEEELEDVELRTQRELARAEDQARFGLAAVPPGFAGSVSLTGLATWGNTDTTSVGLAGRFTLGQGRLNHSLGLGFEYSDPVTVDRVVDLDTGATERVEDDRTRIIGIYDVTYDVTPQFYGFGLARGVYDDLASRNERDIFIGAGPGFRVINQPNVAWRIQAGPGFRHTKNVVTGDTDNDLGAIASSRLFYGISPDMFITNDTDVLYSDVDTLVSNELGLNTRLAGPLSARVGWRLDYSTDPAPGQRSTDNQLTVGVVYSLR